MALPQSILSLDAIRSILDRCEDGAMAGERYQNPPVEKRTDVKRPFYYIRPYVPVITEKGLERKRTSMQLGFVDEMTMRQAKAAREQIMATVNVGKFLVQSQIPFKVVLDKYVEVRLPQIPSTRESYENKIEKHIRPAFTWTNQEKNEPKRLLRMCDIDKPMVEAWLNAKAAAGYSSTPVLPRSVLSMSFARRTYHAAEH